MTNTLPQSTRQSRRWWPPSQALYQSLRPRPFSTSTAKGTVTSHSALIHRSTRKSRKRLISSWAQASHDTSRPSATRTKSASWSLSCSRRRAFLIRRVRVGWIRNNNRAHRILTIMHMWRWSQRSLMARVPSHTQRLTTWRQWTTNRGSALHSHSTKLLVIHM